MNEAEKVAELAIKSVGVIRTDDKGTPFVIIPNDHKIEDLSKYIPFPRRIKANRLFNARQSFIAYVEENKSKTTRVYLTHEHKFIAIFDHHTVEDGPGWQEHRATFPLVQSREWLLWKQGNEQAFNQRNFAAMLEDRAEQIFQPPGRELLQLIRDLEVTQNQIVNGLVNEDGQQVKSCYVLEVSARSGGKGNPIEIPKRISIRVPILENEALREVELRLRLTVTPPGFSLTYEIVQLDRLEKEAIDGAVEGIENATDIKIWKGSPEQPK